MKPTCSVCKTTKDVQWNCGICEADFCLKCWPAHDVTIDRKDVRERWETWSYPAGPGYGAGVIGQKLIEGTFYCAGSPRPSAPSTG